MLSNVNCSQTPLLVVSGPSGVGKGTLLQKVFAESGFPLQMSVSATTRSPRPGEIDGKHYHFLSAGDFENRRLAGEFLECFEVFGTGTWYGTLRQTVAEGLAAGCWVVLEIDVNGAKKVKEQFPDAVTFFIEPKNIDVLKARLQGRGTETEEAMRRRLATALEELKHAGEFDYRIINEDIDTAVQEFTAILKNLRTVSQGVSEAGETA
ncbi:MAG: guanylate kinase [Planctomycetaceae bacterium]|jgi:guanylate kinase|nr:guanylate kinase [Planctomycetaceae bacterium]